MHHCFERRPPLSKRIFIAKDKPSCFGTYRAWGMNLPNVVICISYDVIKGDDRGQTISNYIIHSIIAANIYFFIFLCNYFSVSPHFWVTRNEAICLLGISRISLKLRISSTPPLECMSINYAFRPIQKPKLQFLIFEKCEAEHCIWVWTQWYS